MQLHKPRITTLPVGARIEFDTARGLLDLAVIRRSWEDPLGDTSAIAQSPMKH